MHDDPFDFLSSLPPAPPPPPDRMTPFSNGTDYAMWTERNCERCRKAAPPDASLDAMPCEIEAALAWACVDDGTITLAIRERMGSGRDCRERAT